ncbi:MAG: PAC2 family protein [Candidatus Korarchaeota archaeon]|nr:PAC2 family protein [Thermoproteota archaeon]MCR8487680.1 PAC2 family protein [Thermoproteota archaeon]
MGAAFKNSTIEIIIEDYNALNGIKYLITGFYGLGLCGYLVSKYLCEAALETGSLQRVGFVWSMNLPPMVEVNDSGTFNYPIELYKISNNACVLLTRFQLPSDLHVNIADKITDFVKKYGMIIVLAGGIDIKVFPPGEHEGVDAVYTSNSIFKSLLDSKLIMWNLKKSPPGVVVSGGIATFLMLAELKGIPAVSLLAPTYARTGYIDNIAALKLARRIIDVFGLGIDTTIFDERIKLEIARLIELKAQEEARYKKEEHFKPETEEFGIT